MNLMLMGLALQGASLGQPSPMHTHAIKLYGVDLDVEGWMADNEFQIHRVYLHGGVENILPLLCESDQISLGEACTHLELYQDKE